MKNNTTTQEAIESEVMPEITMETTLTVKTNCSIQYYDMYNCTHIIPEDTQVEVESTIYKDLNGDEYYRTVSVLFPLTRLWKYEVRTSL